MRRWCVGLTLLLALPQQAAWAQFAAVDSAWARTLRAQVTDSARRELCRGGTLSATGVCSGATQSARVSYMRRFINRVDSIANARATPNLTWLSSVAYNSGHQGFANDGVDTVTVCAHVKRYDGRDFVGYPALRLRVIGDSAAFGVREGNPLLSMCGPALQRIGKAWPSDSIKVVWTWGWIKYGEVRKWRPSAALP